MNYKELNLIGSSSPHIRTKDGAGHIMGEVLIAMALPLAFAVYNFGPRALATAAVSAAGCCAFEWLYRATGSSSSETFSPSSLSSSSSAALARTS